MDPRVKHKLSKKTKLQSCYKVGLLCNTMDKMKMKKQKSGGKLEWRVYSWRKEKK